MIDEKVQRLQSKVLGPRQKCKAPEVESKGSKESTKAKIVSAIQGSCEAVAIAGISDVPGLAVEITVGVL